MEPYLNKFSGTKRPWVPDPDARDHDLSSKRRRNDQRLKTTFDSIIERYARDFSSVGDEVDLRTGKVLVNNGHLQCMRSELDNGTGLPSLSQSYDDHWTDDDEEEDGEDDEDGKGSEDEESMTDDVADLHDESEEDELSSDWPTLPPLRSSKAAKQSSRTSEATTTCRIQDQATRPPTESNEARSADISPGQHFAVEKQVPLPEQSTMQLPLPTSQLGVLPTNLEATLQAMNSVFQAQMTAIVNVALAAQGSTSTVAPAQDSAVGLIAIPANNTMPAMNKHSFGNLKSGSPFIRSKRSSTDSPDATSDHEDTHRVILDQFRNSTERLKKRPHDRPIVTGYSRESTPHAPSLWASVKSGRPPKFTVYPTTVAKPQRRGLVPYAPDRPAASERLGTPSRDHRKSQLVVCDAVASPLDARRSSPIVEKPIPSVAVRNAAMMDLPPKTRRTSRLCESDQTVRSQPHLSRRRPLSNPDNGQLRPESHNLVKIPDAGLSRNDIIIADSDADEVVLITPSSTGSSAKASMDRRHLSKPTHDLPSKRRGITLRPKKPISYFQAIPHSGDDIYEDPAENSKDVIDDHRPGFAVQKPSSGGQNDDCKRSSNDVDCPKHLPKGVSLNNANTRTRRTRKDTAKHDPVGDALDWEAFVLKNGPGLPCLHCDCTKASAWIPDPNGSDQRICNACYSHMKRYGTTRPREVCESKHSLAKMHVCDNCGFLSSRKWTPSVDGRRLCTVCKKYSLAHDGQMRPRDLFKERALRCTRCLQLTSCPNRLSNLASVCDDCHDAIFAECVVLPGVNEAARAVEVTSQYEVNFEDESARELITSKFIQDPRTA